MTTSYDLITQRIVQLMTCLLHIHDDIKHMLEHMLTNNNKANYSILRLICVIGHILKINMKIILVNSIFIHNKFIKKNNSREIYLRKSVH